MNRYYEPFYIFLKDDFERWDFIKYIKKELLTDVTDERATHLPRGMRFWLCEDYSICSLTLNENFVFTLKILPISKVSLSGLGIEYLHFSCGRVFDSHAMGFELAKKKLNRMIQCKIII